MYGHQFFTLLCPRSDPRDFVVPPIKGVKGCFPISCSCDQLDAVFFWLSRMGMQPRCACSETEGARPYGFPHTDLHICHYNQQNSLCQFAGPRKKMDVTEHRHGAEPPPTVLSCDHLSPANSHICDSKSCLIQTSVLGALLHVVSFQQQLTDPHNV